MESQIQKIAEKLEQTGRYSVERKFMQHGSTSIYEHSVQVARLSCRIALKFRLKIDYAMLIRGALLHDYFLYDWHNKENGHSWHGISHPYTALTNAKEDYCLTSIEQNIIQRHMFPVTPVPPKTKEAWIVCVADKISAFRETVEPIRAYKILGRIRHLC